MKKLILIFAFCLVSSSAWAATYYVRTDGGTSTQCTGTTDAAYPGSGTGQACAYNDLQYIVRHDTDGTGSFSGTTAISGGDTVIIGNPGGTPGSFRVGYDPSNVWSGCSSSFPYGCFLDYFPAGSSSANRTKIYGRGYDTGCTGTKVQLWAGERADSVVRLSSHTDMQCIEITDHSSCIENGPSDGTVPGTSDPVKCERTTYPYGLWATNGIYSDGADDVLLTNVDIHGMAYRSVFILHVGDWTLDNVNMIAAGFVGWDSDGAGDDSYTGTITLTDSRIDWSGCGEVYPITTTDWRSSTDKHHCWSQDQGGFGDGIGLGDGAPGDWTFINTSVSHNVSDGVDLLHGSGTGTIRFTRSIAEGNAGQAFKSSVGTTYIENSKLIGNCGFFYNQSFTSTKDTSGSSVAFNNCRANGDTISFAIPTGTQKIYIRNSTILSNGNIALYSEGASCTSAVFSVENSIIRGGREAGDDLGLWNGSGGNDTTDLYFAGGSDGNGTGSCGSLAISMNNSLVYGTKNLGSDTDCSGGTNNICGFDPLFSGTIKQGPTSGNGVASDYYQAVDYGDQLGIQSGSSAKDAANESITCDGDCTVDYNNYSRGASWDIGALEYGSTSSGGGGSTTPTVTFGGVKIILGGGKITQ